MKKGQTYFFIFLQIAIIFKSSLYAKGAFLPQNNNKDKYHRDANPKHQHQLPKSHNNGLSRRQEDIQGS